MNYQKRNIRIFISSTFRDMMPEREYLMKFVFPELRRRCAKKFIEVTEIDLRWGVTDEEAKEGKVIEICLNEIDKSRPYFIGILGNRYGWIPTLDDFEKCKNNIEAFLWIKEDINEGLSITEMEIQYGVLRNTNMSGKAFFYLKGYKEDFKEEEKLQKKLDLLKEKVINQNLFPVNRYNSVEEMGNQILFDLWQQIENDYPEDEIPDEHTREKQNHIVVMHNHNIFYTDNQNLIKQIKQLLTNNNQLFVFGEQGQGKTALLANYLSGNSETNNYIFFPCGSTAQSSSLEDMMRFIAEELKRSYNISLTIPQKIENPKDLFTAFLNEVPSDISLYLFLDGIEQLTTDGNNSRLQWIPDSLPQNVKLILSGSFELHLELLEKKNFSILKIDRITPEAVEDITAKYFDLYSKKLHPDLLKNISSFPLAGKPVVLFTLLNELRTFGVHEQLANFLSYFTDSKETEHFFSLFIQRLQRDFPEKKYNLSSVLTSILLSNNGLTENEIIQINNISILNWSQIQNALQYHIINKNGFLSFGNSYIKSAISKQFFSTDELYKLHLAPLISHFKKSFTILSNTNEHEQLVRVLDELPELSVKANETEILKTIFAHIPSIILLFEKRYEALPRLISVLKEKYSLTEIFTENLKQFIANTDDNDKKTEACFIAGHLTSIHHNPYQGIPFLNMVLEVYDQTGGNTFFVTLALKELARTYSQVGEYNTAIYILEKLLPNQHDEDIADTFNLLASNYSASGNFKVAEFLYKDALSFYTHRYGNHHLRVAIQQNNLARLYDVYKNFEEAERYYRNASNIIHTLSGPKNPIHQSIQSNIGILYINNRRLDEAEEIFNNVLKIRTAEYGLNHQLTLKTMNSLGTCKSLKGEWQDASIILKETANRQTELLGAHHSDTLVTLLNIANVYEKTEQFDEAIDILTEVFKTSVEYYGKVNEKTINAAMELAGVYEHSGKITEAEDFYLKTLELQKQFYGENHAYTHYTLDKLKALKSRNNYISDPEKEELLINQKLEDAAKLTKNKNPFEASEKLNEVLDIVNKHFKGNHPALFEALAQLSALNNQQMEYEAAADYASQLLDVFAKILEPGHQAILEFSVLKAYNLYKVGDYNQMSQILFELQDYQEAILNFPKDYIANMSHEMYSFFTRIIECNQKLEKEKDTFEQLFDKLNHVLEEFENLYEANEYEKALLSIDDAIKLATNLNDNYAHAVESPFEYKAIILENMQKKEEALQTINEGLAYIKKWHSILDFKNYNLFKQAGDIINSLEEKKEAENYYMIAHKINKRESDYPNRNTLDLNVSFILHYAAIEKFDKALKITEESIPVSEKLLGNDDETTIWLKNSRKQLLN